MKHGSIHMTLRMDAVITAKLAYAIMVQVTVLGRHIEVRTAAKFPNEMVAGLFNVARNAYVFGALLLRIEFGLQKVMNREMTR